MLSSQYYYKNVHAQIHQIMWYNMHKQVSNVWRKAGASVGHESYSESKNSVGRNGLLLELRIVGIPQG